MRFFQWLESALARPSTRLYSQNFRNQISGLWNWLQQLSPQFPYEIHINDAKYVADVTLLKQSIKVFVFKTKSGYAGGMSESGDLYINLALSQEQTLDTLIHELGHFFDPAGVNTLFINEPYYTPDMHKELGSLYKQTAKLIKKNPKGWNGNISVGKILFYPESKEKHEVYAICSSTKPPIEILDKYQQLYINCIEALKDDKDLQKLFSFVGSYLTGRYYYYTAREYHAFSIEVFEGLYRQTFEYLSNNNANLQYLRQQMLFCLKLAKEKNIKEFIKYLPESMTVQITEALELFFKNPLIHKQFLSDLEETIEEIMSWVNSLYSRGKTPSVKPADIQFPLKPPKPIAGSVRDQYKKKSGIINKL